MTHALPPGDLGVFVCTPVLEDDEPIHHVSHPCDGDWQCLRGAWPGHGEALAMGRGCRGLLAGCHLEMRAVSLDHRRGDGGYGCCYCGGDDSQALHCIRPGEANRFPWESGYDSAWRDIRPDLT